MQILLVLKKHSSMHVKKCTTLDNSLGHFFKENLSTNLFSSLISGTQIFMKLHPIKNKRSATTLVATLTISIGQNMFGVSHKLHCKNVAI